MLRQAFKQKQRRLQDEVLVLGRHVEIALRQAVEVVQQKNIDAAKNLVANNKNISRKCAAIEAEILALLATQQPMAGDLRLLAAMLQVALELERISIHTGEIAGVNLKTKRIDLLDSFTEIDYMAAHVEQMLHQALKAVARLDAKLAQAVPCQDEAVDRLYRQIHQQVVAKIRADQNAVGQAIYLSHIGHHLERIGDRVTNICEWVLFAVTGEMKELNGLGKIAPLPTKERKP